MEYDYEALRVILEEKAGRPVTIEEAIKIGDDRVDLFEILAKVDAELKDKSSSLVS